MTGPTRKLARALGRGGNVASDVTLTIDEFIAEVQVDPHRSILVYRRRHGGRTFVRWRVFHKHYKTGDWYPDKRRWGVIPVHAAKVFAEALAAAPDGRETTDKPAWLAEVDAWQLRRFELMLELHAPERLMDEETRRLFRSPVLDGRRPREP